MDDLLELDKIEAEAVRTAHDLHTAFTKDRVTLVYKNAHDSHWRYPNDGHIHAVAAVLQRMFKCNQRQRTDLRPSPTRDTSGEPLRVRTLARLFYSALEAMDEQMRDFLDHAYQTPVVNRVLWPEDEHELSWNSLTPEDEWHLIWSATLEWASTYERLAQCFLEDEEFASRIEYPQYAHHLISILNAFFAETSSEDVTRGLEASFRFFVDFSKLLSNVGYILIVDTTLDLNTMQQLHSRHNILQDICKHAPPNNELEATILEVLAKLPDTQKKCAICCQPFSKEVFASKVVADDLSYFWPGNVDWIAPNVVGTALWVKEGFESMPLPLPCGHVFCAGCFKAWLDNDGERLQCPFRDADYGVHRHQAVQWMEASRAEYIEEARKNAVLVSGARNKILEAKKTRISDTAKVENVNEDNSAEFEHSKY